MLHRIAELRKILKSPAIFCTLSRKLWIDEAEQLSFIVFAERSAYAHVAQNGSRYARREAIRRRVAARTVLLEYALAFILLPELLLCIRSGRS